MTDITIASGETYDLTTTLNGNIDFANDPISTGTLVIEPTAFENTTFAVGTLNIVETHLGGLVGGYQAGDVIIVRDLATDYAIFDHAPDTAAQNASVSSAFGEILLAETFLGTNEVITVSSSGNLTDNTGLLEGGAVFGQTLSSETIFDLKSYAAGVEYALFGSGVQTGELFITIEADSQQSSIADAVLTSNGDVVICYLRGTNILTPAGERRIETLRPGELVTTHSGGRHPVKWIGVQSFGARFAAKNRERLPVKIEAGALGDNLPHRDLYVSPGHSMLIGDIFVLARDLINGVTITQPERAEDTHYYLLELDTHDCVLAEGTWAETYADAPGLRNQFHNVADFYARFPGQFPPAELQLYAPRPEAGPALEAALRPILARADVTPGPLRGYVESITAEKIEGWAWDEANLDCPVLVEIFDGSKKLGEALACHHRGDLEAAGMGRGRCMFSFALPVGVSQIRVLRASDGAQLLYASRRAA